MPGRRNLARELAQHAVEQPGRLASIHADLRTQIGADDRVLIGPVAILTYLGDVLCLRRPSGKPLRWRTVLRWRLQCGFPLLRGGWNPQLAHPACASVTTTFAVTAWMLSQFDTAARRGLFSVCCSTRVAGRGKAPEQSAIASRKKIAA